MHMKYYTGFHDTLYNKNVYCNALYDQLYNQLCYGDSLRQHLETFISWIAYSYYYFATFGEVAEIFQNSSQWKNFFANPSHKRYCYSPIILIHNCSIRWYVRFPWKYLNFMIILLIAADFFLSSNLLIIE